MNVDRASAETWAGWFRCLGDASRVLVLNRLATAGRPLSVGELVAGLDVGQATVSHHLRVLVETGFVHVQPQGTSNLYRINERCLDCFPSAAELVMGRLPAREGGPSTCLPPWIDEQPRPARRARRITA